MVIRTHRQEPYFTFVKNGQKTIEGRLREGRYKRVAPGDTIRVNNAEDIETVVVKVVRVAIYDSIKEMLEAEPLKKVLPDVDSVADGIGVYRRFYTPEKEQKYGIVAIEIARLA